MQVVTVFQNPLTSFTGPKTIPAILYLPTNILNCLDNFLSPSYRTEDTNSNVKTITFEWLVFQLAHGLNSWFKLHYSTWNQSMLFILPNFKRTICNLKEHIQFCIASRKTILKTRHNIHVLSDWILTFFSLTIFTTVNKLGNKSLEEWPLVYKCGHETMYNYIFTVCLMSLSLAKTTQCCTCIVGW
jgi:hypothetical protein